MSLSRNPSPQPGGGWVTPGSVHTLHSDRSHSRSPAKKTYGELHDHAISWETAKAQSAQVKGYTPALESSNQGFFRRHMRTLSSQLPRFHRRASAKYTSREKLGRGRLPRSREDWRSAAYVAWRLSYRWRRQLLVFLAIVLGTVLFYVTPAYHAYKHASFLGGGSKFLIILAANQGGGVMEWKGPREWAIERDSVRNKKHYAQKHGYELEIVDVSTKKRYAHEWRESWEKVDIMRRCLQDYPHVEWIWWLDLNTYIMEPSISLQSHIFNNLASTTYRDINHWNPLNISHPFTAPYLDPESLSPVGDGLPTSINMIVPQDCSGFNLGSFFVRRSRWLERLLDIWWDPVHYEQKHMQWEHKEQDALEHLYTNHPWIRTHTAFIEQRKICSYPVGACGEARNPKHHYDRQDRDFLVNMAGCEWGRDCWGEMYAFRELSYDINKGLWERIVDWFRSEIKTATGHDKELVSVEPGTGKPKVY